MYSNAGGDIGAMNDVWEMEIKIRGRAYAEYRRQDISLKLGLLSNLPFFLFAHFLLVSPSTTYFANYRFKILVIGIHINATGQ